jgi:urease beta subunit
MAKREANLAKFPSKEAASHRMKQNGEKKQRTRKSVQITMHHHICHKNANLEFHLYLLDGS